jgi:hypothetical protein
MLILLPLEPLSASFAFWIAAGIIGGWPWRCSA